MESRPSNYEAELRDAAYFLMAEQIHRDYLEFIKAIVLPKLNKAHAIKLREMRILSGIAAGEGPMSSSSVAELMRLDPATVARSLIILVGEGIVTTSANLNDARSKLIQLTNRGYDIVQDYNESLANAIEKARRHGGVDMNEEQEIRFMEHMTGVRNRASKFAKMIKKLSREQ